MPRPSGAPEATIPPLRVLIARPGGDRRRWRGSEERHSLTQKWSECMSKASYQRFSRRQMHLRWRQKRFITAQLDNHLATSRCFPVQTKLQVRDFSFPADSHSSTPTKHEFNKVRPFCVRVHVYIAVYGQKGRSRGGGLKKRKRTRKQNFQNGIQMIPGPRGSPKQRSVDTSTSHTYLDTEIMSMPRRYSAPATDSNAKLTIGAMNVRAMVEQQDKDH